MKQKMSKVLSILMVLSMLFTLCAAMTVGTSAATAPYQRTHTYTSGSTTVTVLMWYDVNDQPTGGTLTVSGNGPMSDYLPDGKNPSDYTDAEFAAILPPWHRDFHDKITSVVIKPGVTSIGSLAFADLENLTMCTFEATCTVTRIGRFAFDSAKLTGVLTIPASVQWVREGAYRNCNSIATVTCLGNNTIFENTGLGNMEIVKKLDSASIGKAQYVVGSVDRNDGDIKWEYNSCDKVLTISRNVTASIAIPDVAAGGHPWSKYMKYVKTINVANKITGIGQNAFVSEAGTAPELIQVNLGEDVQYISQNAFAGANKLTSIVLPYDTTYVADAFNAAARTAKLTIYTKRAQTDFYPDAYGSPYIPTGGTVAVHPYANLNWVFESTLTPGAQTTPTFPSYTGGSNSEPDDTTTTTPDGPTGAAATGTLQNGITWAYADHKLTLTATSGSTGVMAEDQDWPWLDKGWEAAVNEVIVYGGIKNLAAGVFEDMVNLTKITLGEGLTSIGDEALRDCENLTTIALPSTVKTIGNKAFYNCEKLATVTLGSKVEEIGDRAFYGCDDLRYIDLKDVETIGSKAFENSGLTAAKHNDVDELYYDSDNETLEKALKNTDYDPDEDKDSTYIPGSDLRWAFDATTGTLTISGGDDLPNFKETDVKPWSAYVSEIKNIVLKDGVTSIGDYAFAELGALQNVTFCDTIEDIGKGAFQGCDRLTALDLPDNIVKIDDDAFLGCFDLETLSLPANLVTIGEDAFNGCYSLTSLDIPEQVETIEDGAFRNCDEIVKVVFRSDDLTIGRNAFDGCDSIEIAVYTGNEPTAKSGNDPVTDHFRERFEGGSNGDIVWLIDYAEGTLTLGGTDTIDDADVWEDLLDEVDILVFGPDVTHIGDSLLENNRDVKYVRMSDSVVSIGESAFESCTKLAKIEFSQNLTEMGRNAFTDCDSLTQVALPDSLTEIPNEAFSACNRLNSVEFGRNVIKIGKNAFQDCVSLTSIVLPESLETLSNGAFSDCSSLVAVFLHGANLEPLTDGIFDGCTALRTAGFHGDEDEWDAIMEDADNEIAKLKPDFYFVVTVDHIYSGGPLDGTLIKTEEYFVKDNDKLTYYPVEHDEHYEPVKESDTTGRIDEDESYEMEYEPRKYTVTIRYKDVETGKIIRFTAGGSTTDRVTYKVKYYEPFAFNTAINGYVMEQTVNIEHVEEDVTIDIPVRAVKYTYTVNYINTRRDGEIIKSVTGTAAYLEDVKVTPETIPGYDIPTGNYAIVDIKKDGEVITIPCTPTSKQITIQYLNADGTIAQPAITQTVYYGDPLTLTAPVIVGMSSDKAEITEAAYAGTDTYTFTYSTAYYTVTVRFIEANSYDNYEIHPTYTAKVKYGDPFSFDLAAHTTDYPTPAAYTAEGGKIEIATVTEDVVKTITYTRKPLTLTVNYVDANGNVIGTETKTQAAGTAYEFDSAMIDGYLTKKVSGTMGTEDATITVTLDVNPDAPPAQPGSNAGKVILVIVIIVAVLGAGGGLFYFLYLKR